MSSSEQRALHGEQSVRQSLITNTGIFIAKFTVFMLTGSAAMFADGMHSLADVINALYRYHGIWSSQNRPDHVHPYGYERQRFVFADRSAFIVLTLGGIFPIIHGYMDLYHPYAILMPAATIAVFSFSGFMESLQVKKALAEVRGQAKQRGLTPWHYYREGTDVMSIAALTEAAVGIAGAAIGIVGISLAWYTQNSIYDASASMLIASSVASASLFIMHKNSARLVGTTLPLHLALKITSSLQEDACVLAIYDVKTEVYGVTSARYKAEVEFNPEWITRKYMRMGTSESRTQDFVGQLTAATQHQESFGQHATDIILRNNAEFLVALCTELKRLESMVRAQLKENGFEKIHVDLEPW
eukprot:NODE_764_length_1921_cov_31.037393_g708_i0.p1 GENE.NODE_764_length_1921_cov_31.037393_g708_i0~~NODE_764_length_1921_cov_31.037393_g708_i0.p1  ORF type:complete len:357 (-),score=56.62 NODE_764_length_1921_cov_31.037393_g708_i0:127-1197(-)